MPTPIAPAIHVTPRQHTLLERLTRRQTSPHQLVQRAQLILHLEAGLPNAQIARMMHLNRGTVRYWRARWLQLTPDLTQAETDILAARASETKSAVESDTQSATESDTQSATESDTQSATESAPASETAAAGVDKALLQLLTEALSDLPRSGAPVTFTAQQVVQIMALACEEPADSQRPVTHWTPRELADEAVQRGIVTSISARSVGRFLKSGGAPTASRGVLAAGHAG